MVDTGTTTGQGIGSGAWFGVVGIVLAASPFLLPFRIASYQSAHVFGVLGVLLGSAALILGAREHGPRRVRAIGLGAGALFLGLFFVGRMFGLV